MISTGSHSQKIAKFVHDSLMAYDQYVLHKPTSMSWSDLQSNQRQALIGIVDVVLSNPHLEAQDLYEIWKDRKLDDGWDAGKYYDPDGRIDPALAGYEHFPLEKKVQDRLVVAMVRAVIPAFVD